MGILTLEVMHHFSAVSSCQTDLLRDLKSSPLVLSRLFTSVQWLQSLCNWLCDIKFVQLLFPLTY